MNNKKTFTLKISKPGLTEEKRKIIESLINNNSTIFIPIDCKVEVLYPTNPKRRGNKRIFKSIIFPCNPFGLSQGAINSLKDIVANLD